MNTHTPKTITTKRGRGTKKLYLCSDGVYRALGPAMWAYRAR